MPKQPEAQPVTFASLKDTLKCQGEPYCWIEQKVIAFQGNDEVLFLHEVAHALVPEAEGPLRNHYHGGMWAAKFAELIRKYFVLRREEHKNASS